MIIELHGGPFDGQRIEVDQKTLAGRKPGISMPFGTHPVRFSHYEIVGGRANFLRTVTVQQIIAERKAKK